MSLTLHEVLRTQIEQFARLGHPALMERFVMRAGEFRYGDRLPLAVSRGRMRQCFRNATHLAWRSPDLTYVEGYVMLPGIALPIHHAWVIDVRGAIIDNTLREPETHQYMGVRFPRDVLNAELEKQSVYGLLELECGVLNNELMDRLAPGVVAEAFAVRRQCSITVTEE